MLKITITAKDEDLEWEEEEMVTSIEKAEEALGRIEKHWQNEVTLADFEGKKPAEEEELPF